MRKRLALVVCGLFGHRWSQSRGLPSYALGGWRWGNERSCRRCGIDDEVEIVARIPYPDHEPLTVIEQDHRLIQERDE